MTVMFAKLTVSLLFLHLTLGIPRDAPKTESTKSSQSSGLHFGRSKKPHIVVILADDLGWNDVSLHGADQIPTPNIDALGYNGVILNSHYVSAMCTPSRSSLMTGKYPIHLGMQHSVILETEPRGLPLKEKLLPEYLREAGYSTHAVGKWHLGYYKREYTPTYRGFDTHFGYWNGLNDYYNHITQSTIEKWRGFDMRRNMSVAWDSKGKYSTDLFTEEAVRLIDEHDTQTPMFMYLAHLAVHSGNPDDPYQAPDEEIAKFSYIEDPERRTYAAMVSKLDASVGDVMAALRRRRMLDNSIIVFMTDNGAPTMGIYNNSGSNYPLRGIKNSPWEGAVRGAAAIWSPLIKKPRRVSDQLISITDWLPTFWSAADMDSSDLGAIDGINMWPTLVNDRTSPRSEVLINIDDTDNYAALRRGDYKYVIGHTNSGDKWYGESGRTGHGDFGSPKSEAYADTVLNSKTGVAIGGVITARQIANLRKRRDVKLPYNDDGDDDESKKLLTPVDIMKLRAGATILCDPKKRHEHVCDAVKAPCLFNIKEDPCEQINLAEQRPIVLAALEQSLIRYRQSAIPASNLKTDPLANPANWGGIWANWRDPNPLDFDRPTNVTSRLSGSTIAVIAVLLGLTIVAAMIIVAIRFSKRTNLQCQHGDLPTISDNDVSMNGAKYEELQTLKDRREVQTLTELNSIKDIGRSID